MVFKYNHTIGSISYRSLVDFRHIIQRIYYFPYYLSSYRAFLLYFTIQLRWIVSSISSMNQFHSCKYYSRKSSLLIFSSILLRQSESVSLNESQWENSSGVMQRFKALHKVTMVPFLNPFRLTMLLNCNLQKY